MKIRTVKFRLYPDDIPTGYAVGFQATVNGRTFYRDTLISLEESNELSDEEIISLAWKKIKDSMITEKERIENIPVVLGKEFNVDELGDVQEPEEEPVEEPEEEPEGE